MGSCLYGESKQEIYETAIFSAAVCSKRGSRKSMEDSHSICLSIPDHPLYSLFAVFDGFNGDDASKYLRNNLTETLNELPTLKDDELIIDAIHKMDKTFLNLNDENINILAGSTLVFALINDELIPSSSSTTTTTTTLLQSKCNKKVRIFWAGDSRALLIRENKKDFEELTFDHHCNLEIEKNRICNPLSNGTIIDNKIDGITELSRSFGCYSMKNNKNLRDDEQKQISLAECKHILCKSNETLLLFSDGLSQRWSNKQIIQNYIFQWSQHHQYPDPMQNSLNYLCEQCIDEGSTDNITAISIVFK